MANVAHLQRSAGNRAVHALLQRCGGVTHEGCDCAGDERLAAGERGPSSGAPEVGLAGGPISAGLAQRIDVARGGGTSLDSGARGRMEGAFGTSFGDVRVHADGEAHALNQSVSAVAFTTGRDIFFQNGVYQPGTAEGDRLLAHELTHVVQQRSMGGSGPLTVGPADDPYEQEADAQSASIHRQILRCSSGEGLAGEKELA